MHNLQTEFNKTLLVLKKVFSHGPNFCVGQKQWMCVDRSCFRNTQNIIPANLYYHSKCTIVPFHVGLYPFQWSFIKWKSHVSQSQSHNCRFLLKLLYDSRTYSPRIIIVHFCVNWDRIFCLHAWTVFVVCFVLFTESVLFVVVGSLEDTDENIWTSL